MFSASASCVRASGTQRYYSSGFLRCVMCAAAQGSNTPKLSLYSVLYCLTTFAIGLKLTPLVVLSWVENWTPSQEVL